LTDEEELKNAARMEALEELARRRGVPLKQLMDQLGIRRISERLSAELKAALAAQASSCCEYCLCPVAYAPDPFSIEHVVPLAKGASVVSRTWLARVMAAITAKERRPRRPIRPAD